MGRLIDRTGQVFGRLTALEHVGFNRNGNALWKCQCSCGNVAVADAGELKKGKTRSCGCLVTETNQGRLTTHGKSKTPAHTAWVNMRMRCTNPNDENFRHYGGRGITVCERWQDFANFLADMGEPTAGLTLDRIEVNGNYEPGNCRWATFTEQVRNRRNSLHLELNGRRMSAQEWAHEIGVRYDTLWRRLKAGWTVERALTTPAKEMRHG